jgi:type I restriction enzyme M protein
VKKTKTKTNGNGAGANGANVMPATTAQRLGTILKGSRDIMRKDKGLSGEIDRIPVLTWIMFLKFLDDMESMRAEEAKLSGKKFKPAIEPPYRWRDWAAKEDGITGDELIAFINQEECRRPDGSKGPGLFAYLRALRGAEGGDRRDVIATVFKGTVNRMINGYLLRDVINKVNGIHFTSSDEIHTLGNFYESMLKEMRDAAGDSGEFYTPRAVVRFMVEVIDPKIGETVLDPACGTGGFLVEAYSHMEKQCKTVQQRRQLQQGTILGNEAKPLPYLLAQMNLLLHGLETPRIEPGNSLAVALREIGDKDRVDVILTNPPFGGEEERGILSNFPEDKQTAETALLFLQLIMRKLKRAPKPGRAAVVVPNGVLFGDGIAARIKEEMLREFNLHTIVRLPNGVFEPYTPISTNILFFDRTGTTGDVWYYEQPLPEGRKKYSKTSPLLFEEFATCIEWWKHREENEQAWRVPAAKLLEQGCNLDISNPRAGAARPVEAPSVLIAQAIDHERRAMDALERIAHQLKLGGAA